MLTNLQDLATCLEDDCFRNDISLRRFHQVMCFINNLIVPSCFQGSAVGLVKNLALMAYISVGSQPSPILEFLEEWSMENLEEVSPTAIAEYAQLFLCIVAKSSVVSDDSSSGDLVFCMLVAADKHSIIISISKLRMLLG